MFLISTLREKERDRKLENRHRIDKYVINKRSFNTKEFFYKNSLKILELFSLVCIIQNSLSWFRNIFSEWNISEDDVDLDHVQVNWSWKWIVGLDLGWLSQQLADQSKFFSMIHFLSTIHLHMIQPIDDIGGCKFITP